MVQRHPLVNLMTYQQNSCPRRCWTNEFAKYSKCIVAIPPCRGQENQRVATQKCAQAIEAHEDRTGAADEKAGKARSSAENDEYFQFYADATETGHRQARQT